MSEEIVISPDSKLVRESKGSEEILISPDVNFVRELKGAGADTLKKCYQCATCSVVCPISPDNKPFPRKEMIMAQWGMKEQLAADPDIWLCHNCNDCSKYCPRGAKPGDVLSVLRKQSIQENAIPKFMGRIVSEPKFLLVALAIPLVILLGVLIGTGRLGIPEGNIVYSKFLHQDTIEKIFIPAMAIALVCFVMGLKRFWGTMVEANGPATAKPFVGALIETLTEFLGHKRFSKCGPNADRKTGHLFVFFAFVGLAIVTTWITVYFYLPEPAKKLSPISQSDPMKWLANASALALLVGGFLLASNRMKDKGFKTTNSAFDWTFLLIVILLGVTGALTELVRLAGIAEIAYPVYFIHLLFVFYTIILFPFSKLAHMGYRTLAITYSKMAGRDVTI